MAFLWWTRRSFHTGFDLPSLRAGLVTLFGGVLAVTCIGATVLWSVIPTHRGGRPITWATAWWATAGRLVGVRTVALNQRVDAFLYPALLAIGLGLAAVVLVLAFRPVVDRRRTGGHSEIADRAADIVRRHGTGTLDYFALRATSSGSSTATRSSPTPSSAASAWSRPTPSAPFSERADVWDSFRRFVDRHGWGLGVHGAGEEWLPTYQALGHARRLHRRRGGRRPPGVLLEGGKLKGLRQAVNRVARYGYTVSLPRPGPPDPEDAACMASSWPRAAAERTSAASP